MELGLAKKLSFVNFGEVCRGCSVNCCKKFYAVLLPDEEGVFNGVSFDIETRLGSVKAIGSYGGRQCIFLDENGLCRIYENRPFDCRLWPIILYYDFNTNEKVVYLDLECPAAKSDRIPKDFVDRVIDVLRNSDIDVEWLKKYTLAPWPNRLKEIARFR